MAGQRRELARLAARFAAKAAMKVLRPGDAAVPWPSIEVVSNAAGVPQLALHGPAAELAAAAGLTDFALTLRPTRTTTPRRSSWGH